MRNLFALLLVTLLSIGTLTACGSDKDASDAADSGSAVTGEGSGSVSQPDGSLTDDTLTGDGSALTDPDGDGVDENVTDPDGNGMGSSASGSGAVAGTSTTTGTTPGTTAGTVTKQHSVIRGATYEQMLRNAYVHDTDGDLTDHENSVTPGTVY